MAEMVKDTVDLIRPLAADRKIDILAPSATDEAVAVQADHQRLKQVLLNLASNAVKYNRYGGSIRVAYQATAPGRVTIVVEDTGPGLAPDKLARLLTPFDRPGAEQTDVQGTGMGLALSKGLVEAMGGSLSADTTEGGDQLRHRAAGGDRRQRLPRRGLHPAAHAGARPRRPPHRPLRRGQPVQPPRVPDQAAGRRPVPGGGRQPAVAGPQPVLT